MWLPGDEELLAFRRMGVWLVGLLERRGLQNIIEGK